MRKILFISLFVLSFFGATAQLRTTKNASMRGDDPYPQLIDSANVYLNKQPAKAIKFLEEALVLASEEKGDARTKECYLLLAKANYNLKLYNQSVRFYEKVKPTVVAAEKKSADMKVKMRGEAKVMKEEEKSSYKLSGDVEVLKGMVLDYEGLKEYGKAEAFLLELEKTTTFAGTHDGRAWIANARGRMAFNTNDMAAAITYFKLVSNDEKNISSKALVVEANDYLGRIYSQQKDKISAKKYYSKSASNAAETKDEGIITRQNSMLKQEYKGEGDYEKVLEINENISRQTENDTIKNQLMLENANVYLDQNKPDRAIPVLEQTIVNSNKLGQLEEKAEAYKSLSKAYEKKGDFEKAYEHHEIYVNLMDSLNKKKELIIANDLTETNEVSESNQRIELLEKNKQLSDQMIQQLENERKFQETLIYGLIIFIVIVVISAYLLYKNIKQKKIANQLLALKSLRSQMNPHFIFNALNSVNSFISSNDQKTANKYLADFSKLMRSVLENSQKDFVPLSEEIEVLRLYLKLEHFRFSNKFDYTFEVDENLVVDQYKVPPMLIQPYIENSVWHGLRYKEEKGLLDVRVAANGDSLTVTITDNGIGRKKSQELKTHNQKQNESMGLKNIESRLQIINDLFKTNLKVQVQDANPKTGEGTIVNISIPFQKE